MTQSAQSAAAPAAETPQQPTSPQQLLARLEALDIADQNHQHAAVFTVEEAKALRGELTGGHIKNLFLRNKKEEMWLVVAEEDKRIDLKALGEKRARASLLRFAGPAAAIPRGLAGRGHAVRHHQRQGPHGESGAGPRPMGFNPVNAHPLVNTMTTALSPQDLVKFLEFEGHRPDPPGLRLKSGPA